jgi:hypothetical protein
MKNMNNTDNANAGSGATRKAFYNRFLLLVAGLGGLFYGVDVGIIAGACGIDIAWVALLADG